MFKIRVLLFVLTIEFMQIGFAQDLPDLITDRPDATESALILT